MAKLLLIDDDAFFSELLADWLTDGGHTVTRAENGRVGLAALSELRHDLVISDLFMPEMDGLEFLRALAECPWQPPVVAISGGHPSLGNGLLKVSEKLGARAMLTKPFTQQKLLDTVAALLAPGTADSQNP